jgi:hypothetical protein
MPKVRYVLKKEGILGMDLIETLEHVKLNECTYYKLRDYLRYLEREQNARRDI